jgi:hypothetical protein
MRRDGCEGEEKEGDRRGQREEVVKRGRLGVMREVINEDRTYP